MVTPAEKRAAALAVSRYGVDRARLQQVLQAVLRAKARGQSVNLLDALVAQQLLTSEQARDLSLDLFDTQLDPHRPKPAREVHTPLPQQTDPPQAGAFDMPTHLGGFRVLRPLAEGGMGAVFLGYHEGRGLHVAIKVLPDHLAANQSYVDRFYREARNVALLDHPNVIHSIAAGRDPASGKHYLVLEYVDGPSAHALLAEHGRLAVGDAVHIVLDVARALEHAHSRSIVHRDIKPDNILLTLSGVAKLADLGLAKRTDEASHLTAARQGFGTPFYMPYEQALNAKQADGRSDIYALGATLYHLVTGALPFPGANHLEIVEKKDIGDFPPASSHCADVPPVLDGILDRMMARYPEDRYQTASELIVELERANLAAAVPSFVDPDLALKDPVMRARLTAPAPQPTRLDPDAPVRRRKHASTPTWYLRYKDRDGKARKARASEEWIVGRLRQGRLSLRVLVCPEADGEFRPLTAYAPFREHAEALARRRARRRKAEAKAEPEAAPVPPPPSRRAYYWAAGLAAVAVAAVGLILKLARVW